MARSIFFDDAFKAAHPEGWTVEERLAALAAVPRVPQQEQEHEGDPESRRLAGERALALVKKLLDGGGWYLSAIELDIDLDGEEFQAEALAILAEAGMTRDR